MKRDDKKREKKRKSKRSDEKKEERPKKDKKRERGEEDLRMEKLVRLQLVEVSLGRVKPGTSPPRDGREDRSRPYTGREVGPFIKHAPDRLLRRCVLALPEQPGSGQADSERPGIVGCSIGEVK